MSDEFIAGWLAMPLWAQLAVAFFLLMVVVMFVGPVVDQRRARRRFEALAAGKGALITPGHDGFTASFPVADNGRLLAVRRELRQPGRGGSYRGPRGHLLIVETPLAGSLWASHGVDIAPHGRLGQALMRRLTPGDASIDRRFALRQDGVPVRAGWFDESTRAAVAALFDLPAVAGAGRLWVQEGRLQYISDQPETIDAVALTALTGAVADVAAAFERTAGRHGPQS